MLAAPVGVVVYFLHYFLAAAPPATAGCSIATGLALVAVALAAHDGGLCETMRLKERVVNTPFLSLFGREARCVVWCDPHSSSPHLSSPQNWVSEVGELMVPPG